MSSTNPLYSKLSRIDPLTNIDKCLVHIRDLSDHVKLYDLPSRCHHDIFACAVRLLRSEDEQYANAGYLLLDVLLSEQHEVSNVLRYEIYQTMWGLRGSFHKSRRPIFLTSLLKQGRDIGGFEMTALAILNDVTRECHEMYRAQAETDKQVRVGDVQNAMATSQDAFHKSLHLTCGVLKQGKGLDQTHVPDLVEQVSNMIEATVVSIDIIQLLKVFDALLTFGSVVSNELLPTVVRSICIAHGFDADATHAGTTEQAWFSFSTLARTHLEQHGIYHVLYVLNDSNPVDETGARETAGALRILSRILGEIKEDSPCMVDMEALLSTFSNTSIKSEPTCFHHDHLYLLQLLVEQEPLRKMLLGVSDWTEITDMLYDMHGKVRACESRHSDFLDHILTQLDRLKMSEAQRESLDRLYIRLALHIPSHLANGALQRFQRSLAAEDAFLEMQLLADGFVDCSTCAMDVRIRAVEILRQTCLDLQTCGSSHAMPCLQLAFKLMSTADINVAIHERLVKLTADYIAQDAGEDDDAFDQVVKLLAREARRKSVISTAVTCASSAVAGLVRLFMISMHTLGSRAGRVFEILLDLISEPADADPSATVAALKLLARLRADVNHKMFLISNAEGEILARFIHRAEAMTKSDSAQSATDGVRPRPAVWMYGEFAGLPAEPQNAVSHVLTSHDKKLAPDVITLDTRRMLRAILRILKEECDWEVYSYVIVHLGGQLTNHTLFVDALPEIGEIRALVARQISSTKVVRPPVESGLKQADVAVCLCNVLTMLIGYRRHFEKEARREMIQAFHDGLTAWDTTTIHCVHALTICCYELPDLMWRFVLPVVEKMAKLLTKADAAIHLLEFLAGLSRLPELLRGFNGEELKVVFGVCFSYIKYARGKRFDDARRKARQITPSSTIRQSGSNTEGLARRNITATAVSTAIPAVTTSANDISQYVFTLAYSVITFYFLQLRREVRQKYLNWMLPQLLAKDEAGDTEDQALVTLDLIWRIATRDSPANEIEKPEEAPSGTAWWTTSFSVLSISLAKTEDLAQINERRASGIDYWTVPLGRKTSPDEVYSEQFGDVHVGPFPDGWDPVSLPKTDATNRAIDFVDRTLAVDFYKVGVIYAGESQTTEAEILGNTMGSPDYIQLLGGLGERLNLMGVKHNTMGLDRHGADGESTIWHRDSVTALIYHVTTFMPTNLASDPACIRKKAHIGNDFVNIVFNNSSLPFSFHTFPSAFNYVYIVVTPEARATFIETRTKSQQEGWFEESWFKVQVLTRHDFPSISSAGTTKVVSGKTLAVYVRNLALTACVFCNVWAAREGGGKPSSWKARLQHIRTIRERYG